MQLPSTRALCLTIVSLTLLLTGTAACGASFVSSTASCGTPPSQSSVQASLTPGVTSVASLATCSATAQANFGTLRGSAATSASDNSQGSYNSQFSIEYFLTDPNVGANTPTTLVIPLDYHVEIGAGLGTAAFVMFLDSNVSPFWLINLTSTGDPNGANICPSPAATLPRCNGNFAGTLSVSTPAVINSTLPNRFWITMYGVTYNVGTSDASNTVTIGSSTMPVGMTVSYHDLTGNPLNLQNASSGVPEPAALGLVAAALSAIVVKRRFA